MASADVDAADDTAADDRAAMDHIETRAAEISAEQVAEAIQQLEADGDLTEEQRQAVESLGERLTERLLAAPRASLREADTRDDDTAATALELFSRGSGR